MDRSAGKGSAVPVSLERWQNRPVRISVYAPGGRERILASLQGTVVSTSDEGILVDLLSPFQHFWHEADMVVEVLLPQALVRFESKALSDHEARTLNHLAIRRPMYVDAIQRRQHHRIDMVLPVQVTWDGTPSRVLGKVLNLSAGGLGLLLEKPVPEGEDLRVDFITHEGTRYHGLPARVVRLKVEAEGAVVAVHFRQVHPDVIAALTSYVNRLLSGDGAGNWLGKVSM